VRGVGIEAVAQHLRPAAGQRAGARPVDELVLDAAPPDTEPAIKPTSRMATVESGGGATPTPGARDRSQHDAVALLQPMCRLAQYIQIDVVHGVGCGLACCLHRAAEPKNALNCLRRDYRRRLNGSFAEVRSVSATSAVGPERDCAAFGRSRSAGILPRSMMATRE
jgi:hypothetical protein